MSRTSLIFLIIASLLAPDYVFTQGGEALFIANQGQWHQNVRYKLKLNQGAVFFEDQGYTAVLSQSHGHKHHDHDHAPHPHTPIKSLALQMRWANARPEQTTIRTAEPTDFYHNYIRGNDPSRWHGRIPIYRQLTYNNLYPGVNVHYYGQNGRLKYDIILKPGARAEDVGMQYFGMDDIYLREGRLVLQSALGDVEEFIPECYQLINNEKVYLNCQYRIRNGIVKFDLGRYDKDHTVYIDPVLVFSSYIGSSGQSWGFTATYGQQDDFYGGGVAFDQFYTITPGVFQDSLAGSVDMAINKFSADGSNLLYSTFIGGSQEDIPHSLVVNDRDELFILGNTGSDNFPITSGAYQDSFVAGDFVQMPFSGFTFNQGSNLVVLRMSADGSQLLNSTYFGGNVLDGVNRRYNRNYGDYARSEIITLDNGNVAVASSSLSPNLPLNRVGTLPNDSSQNAMILVFDESLSNLIWGNYFGGSETETGYSVRAHGNSVFLGGATNSTDLSVHSTAHQDSLGGNFDGYIARFDINTGQFLGATYMGTPSTERTFNIEVDRMGDVYALGQCSQNFDITPGVYHVPNSRQFIRKYSQNLDSLQWSTQIGSGFNKSDLIPNAFMVDRCLNIYLSGWNGRSNIAANNFINANTSALPVTADAFQDSTDGSDFYFMILNRNADSLLFASYFGGSSDEHVDGGTSRFSPEGIVYQAACAGCRTTDGFPTTPNAYAPTKPDNSCNYGAIKFDFQITVRSRPEINFSNDVDTICDQLEVKLTNNSVNANQFFWDFGNGQTSTLEEPVAIFDSLGTYTITLVAVDTLCDITDTNTIVVVHDRGEEPTADFEADYSGCDKNYRVNFENSSSKADTYSWDFGDGSSSSAFSPKHDYQDTGTYLVRLIAYDSVCDKRDTATATISFRDTTQPPEIFITYDECSDGRLDVVLANDRKRYTYQWYVNGLSAGNDRKPVVVVQEPGLVEVTADVTDSLCNNIFSISQTYYLERIGLPTYVPNVFTPNADQVNDRFRISGISCGDQTYLRIFNRWGQLVFETNRPFDEFWDGMIGGKKAPDGVYSYILKNGESEKRGHLTLIQ